MLNQTIVMGRLTRDPELRRTQSGTAVTSFTLAVERDYKDQATGEKATDFVDIVAWRSTAEFVCNYFSKGRMAVVAGRLQNRSWEDQDGNRHKVTEVVADRVYFGDSKRSETTASQPAASAQSPYAPPAYGDNHSQYTQTSFTELPDDDRELPF